MNTDILIIIIGIVLFILLILISIVRISKKKMKFFTRKIEEATTNIDIFLEKKKELLGKTKEFIEDENYFSDFQDISFDEIDNFRIKEILDDYHEKLQEKLFEDDNLTKNTEFDNLLEEIIDNNCNLDGTIKYYNDSVNQYFKLKHKFPIKFVKFLCGFKAYELYEIKKTNPFVY